MSAIHLGMRSRLLWVMMLRDGAVVPSAASHCVRRPACRSQRRVQERRGKQADPRGDDSLTLLARGVHVPLFSMTQDKPKPRFAPIHYMLPQVTKTLCCLPARLDFPALHIADFRHGAHIYAVRTRVGRRKSPAGPPQTRKLEANLPPRQEAPVQAGT